MTKEERISKAAKEIYQEWTKQTKEFVKKNLRKTFKKFSLDNKMEVKIIADGEKFFMDKVAQVILVLEKGEHFISKKYLMKGRRIPGWVTLQGQLPLGRKVEESVYHSHGGDDFIPYEDPYDE